MVKFFSVQRCFGVLVGAWRWGQWGTISRAPCLWGARNDWRGSKKTQHFRKNFVQFNTFDSDRPQVRTWWRQTCSLPRAPSSLGTPLGLAIEDGMLFQRIFKIFRHTVSEQAWLKCFHICCYNLKREPFNSSIEFFRLSAFHLSHRRFVFQSLHFPAGTFPLLANDFCKFALFTESQWNVVID